MDPLCLALTASILLWAALAGLRAAGIAALRHPVHEWSSLVSRMQATPALEAVAVTPGDQDRAAGATASPDEARGPAARSPKRMDPYRDVRKHLAAAAVVILSVAAAGAFLLLG